MDIGYNKKTVWDYINGDYIENLDELENNYKFLIDVIKITRDKNMYNLCSDEVKCNYEFISFLIDFFSDDKKFINDVALEYLSKIDSDDITFKELVFKMCNIFEKDINKDDYMMLFVKRAAICTCERMVIDGIIEEETDLNKKKLFGKGFILFQSSDFGKSSVILDYVVKVLLEEIFYDDSNLSLEEVIHKNFSSLEKLYDFGIRNFIFSYVSKYDTFLADYIVVHSELIGDIEKSIDRIIKNWDAYLIRTKKRKDSIFMQESFNLIEEYNASFTYTEICAYIDSLNILPYELDDMEYEEDCLSTTIDIKNISLKDYICIKKIISLAEEIYLSPVINSDINIPKNNTISCGKVLKFVPKTTKNN